MRLTLLLLPFVAAVAACTQVDDGKPPCVPGESEYFCDGECSARICPDFHYERRYVSALRCGKDLYHAIGRFHEHVRSCRLAESYLPVGAAGGTYHEQGETEGAATGTWDPLPPPGQGDCVP